MINRFNKLKKYETKTGREFTLYTTEGYDPAYPIVGNIKGSKCCACFNWNCVNRSNPDYNLVEVKPRIKRTEWLNIYPNGVLTNYASKGEADICAASYRIACVKVEIDCEEGEGL